MRGEGEVTSRSIVSLFEQIFHIPRTPVLSFFEKLKMKAELVKVWWKGGWQGKERTCVHEVEKGKSRKSVKVTTIRNEWEGKKKKEKRVTKGTGWNEEKLLSATYGNVTDRHLRIVLSCTWVDSIGHIFFVPRSNFYGEFNIRSGKCIVCNVVGNFCIPVLYELKV